MRSRGAALLGGGCATSCLACSSPVPDDRRRIQGDLRDLAKSRPELPALDGDPYSPFESRRYLPAVRRLTAPESPTVRPSGLRSVAEVRSIVFDKRRFAKVLGRRTAILGTPLAPVLAGLCACRRLPSPRLPDRARPSASELARAWQSQELADPAGGVARSRPGRMQEGRVLQRMPSFERHLGRERPPECAPPPEWRRQYPGAAAAHRTLSTEMVPGPAPDMRSLTLSSLICVSILATRSWSCLLRATACAPRMSSCRLCR